jgi:hypothetical protein
MPSLSASVGEAANAAGVNAKHDVTMVQIMLRVAKHPKTDLPYFGANYNGHYNHALKEAIQAFQVTSNLASPPAHAHPHGAQHASTSGKPAASPTPLNPKAPEPYGLIGVDSETFKRLVEEVVRVKPKYNRLLVIPKSKLAYLAAEESQFNDAKMEIANSGLEDDFGKAVTLLVTTIYNEYKIVLKGWGTKTSYLRSFKEQHEALKSGESSAGPGESLHNYGLAIDVGYKGMILILEDGAEHEIKNETDFDNFNKRDHPHYSRENVLTSIRNPIWERPTGPLFRIRKDGGKDNDPNHFQKYHTANPNWPKDPYTERCVDMHRSLAEHLSNVTSGGGTQIQWEAAPHGHYRCDLGLGIKPIDVGRADEVWSGHARLTKDQYVQALNQARANDGDPRLKEADVSLARFNEVLKNLKEAFDEAERRSDDWIAYQSDGSPL